MIVPEDHEALRSFYLNSDQTDLSIEKCLSRVTITRKTDIRTAALDLKSFAGQLGFDIAVTADISSKKWLRDENERSINREVFGWKKQDDAWWEDGNSALFSPIAMASRYESEPFWVDDIGVHGFSPNRYLEELEFSQYLELELGAHCALVVPVHLPFGQIGIACYVPRDRTILDLSEPYSRFSQMLALLSHRFLKSYTGIRKSNYCILSNCNLTKRQVQCLHWAALGKTDQETAVILSLSHSTVRHHIKTAAKSLDCVNKSQAVFKAGQLGFLGALDKDMKSSRHACTSRPRQIVWDKSAE